jgi:hypothetical protein
MRCAHGCASRERGRARFAFAPALVTLLLLAVVITLGSPDARAAAGEFLHLRGIDIFPVPIVRRRFPRSSSRWPASARRSDDARRRVHFTPRLPASADLGAPDDVFVETVGTTDRLTLVYRQRAGIPVSASAGVSALVVEARGTVDEALFAKATGPGTTVQSVSVNGGQGYWLEGAPHVFFYRDPSGNVVNDTLAPGR